MESQVEEFEYSEEDFIVELETGETDDPICSKFDSVLRAGWDCAMDAGYFRYTMDHIQTRIVPGKFYFLSQLNTKRATERRKPQAIESLQQPFDPNSFNFTKARRGECIMKLSKRHHRVADTCAIAASAGNRQPPSPACNGLAEEKSDHYVLINVSPLEYGNSLLVPHMHSCLPQVITYDTIVLALEMMLLSSHRGFRIGFNSLCAFASVNHLHVHCWYADHPLYTETIQGSPLEGSCYEMVESPARGFVFQLDGSTVQEVARSVYKVAQYLHHNEIAHNLFMTRGATLQNDGRGTIRILVWPRHSVYGVKDESAFNMAVAELGGHIPIKHVEEFNNLTEERILQTFAENSFNEEEFTKIRTKIIATLRE